MTPEPLIDPANLDGGCVLYDRDAIRRFIPQRHEMEFLSAVVLFDRDRGLAAGYHDVSLDGFWSRGLPPGDATLPSMLICEAAAQLCGFYGGLIDLAPGIILGFGGMDSVRFLGVARPGERLVVAAKALRLRPRQQVFSAQAFVGQRMVFHGRIVGVPLS